MLTQSDPRPPPCPSCKSTRTIRTHEQCGERLFFCPMCEHSWAVRPGALTLKAKKKHVP
jgi:hypothetical protein